MAVLVSASSAGRGLDPRTTPGEPWSKAQLNAIGQATIINTKNDVKVFPCKFRLPGKSALTVTVWWCQERWSCPHPSGRHVRLSCQGFLYHLASLMHKKSKFALQTASKKGAALTV